VEEIDQNAFNRIDNKRDLLMGVPDNHPGLRRQIQEDYFRHIYHSAAIEGNTFTLSQTRSLVETRLAIGGKSVVEHNEILGMDAALHFINSSLIQRLGKIRAQDILDLHHRVLGFVDPFEAGRYRTTQVFVGDFTPPGAPEVKGLMEEFIEWLNSDDALSLHPIELAALAHYKLVYIHPFYDGNGRTSRLLMNLVLMQAGYPPIIIKVDEKHEYYKHLQTANDGDVRPFIRFIARCTERTVDDYLMATIEDINIKKSISSYLDDGKTIILEDFSKG
jgi:Fic family protein